MKKPDVPWRASLGKLRVLRSNGPVSNARHPAVLSEAEFTANTRSHTKSFFRKDHMIFLAVKIYRNCLISWDRADKYVLRFGYIINLINPSDFTNVSGWAITQA